MSQRAPTKDEEDGFWTILRAAAPRWKAIELDRLLAYHLRAPESGSADPSIVAEAGFAAFSSAAPRQRAELMASLSASPEFKSAKKTLGIRNPKPAPGPKRPRAPKPGPSDEELSAFWTRLESSAGAWAAPLNLDNLLAYYLRQPLSGAPETQDVIEAHKNGFFGAPPDRQREAMESLSRTAEVKSAIKAERPAPAAKARRPQP